MCVLAIAFRARPNWRLVVAANRDEYHDRPAATLARWPDIDIIAGRDLRAGGTWLGVSESNRFAAVTNIRGFGAPDPGLLSRGALIADLLADASARRPPSGQLKRYNPFHAVVASSTNAWLLSNRPSTVVRPMPRGIHAISNGPLDTPWRKTLRLKEALREWLNERQPHADHLFAILRDDTPPPASAADPAALFVDDRIYGTRSSALVLIDHTGAGRIIERRYDRQAQAIGDTQVCFTWE